MQAISSTISSSFADQEPVKFFSTRETATYVSLLSGEFINTLSTIEEATGISDSSIQSTDSTAIHSGSSSVVDDNEMISELADDYNLSVSTSNSPKKKNFSSDSHYDHRDPESSDYNDITIDIDDDYFRPGCELDTNVCSASTIDIVLGCSFEEDLQNISHPVSPTASFDDQLDDTISAIAMDALLLLSAGTPESNYDYNVDPSMIIDKETGSELDVSDTVKPTISHNSTHRGRRQVWNRLTKWLHKKTSNAEIVNKDSTSTNAEEVKTGELSAFKTVKVDVENGDDNRSINSLLYELESLTELTPVSSIDMFEHMNCLSSNASSLASSAEYLSINDTVEADGSSPSVSDLLATEQNDNGYSPSISSSLVAEQDDGETIYFSDEGNMISTVYSLDDDETVIGDYCPSISSSLVAEQDDNETIYLPNKNSIIVADLKTNQTLKLTNGGRKTYKIVSFGFWDGLLKIPAYANSSILTEIKIDDNILNN
ncbi:unnamed protein product [Ambrosiozyma monospora]|uniref:Unnamed protein product n=1 Tax=Ambrosiozyma monospora TaxID=43982 RepID=A0ACB5T509_AMBMO|nr:unnamed protein product [Ambrosiozyma monospora]